MLRREETRTARAVGWVVNERERMGDEWGTHTEGLEGCRTE